MSTQGIISNEEIDRVHRENGAEFAGVTSRQVVNMGVLNCAAGQHQHSTSEKILRDHGLINRSYGLTTKGKVYLFEAFKGSGCSYGNAPGALAGISKEDVLSAIETLFDEKGD